MLSRWVVNFFSLKSGLRTEMTNGILYLSSCMKSSLFVAFMIKCRPDFTEYKSSEKPMNTLHFSPLVLFLLHYEFILLPWEFHGISMEFVLSSCLCWNAFSRIIPRTLWNGDATIYPAAFMVSEFLRSNNINLLRQCFTNGISRCTMPFTYLHVKTIVHLDIRSWNFGESNLCCYYGWTLIP